MPNIIVISGIIGIEVLADDIRAELNKYQGQDVEIEINSPGGLIVDGIETFNLLRMHSGKVTARIMGLAGSMASIIPMAADEIQVFDNSVFFIHLALAYIYGNKKILRNEADILDGFDKMLINALSKKSGKMAEDLELMMEKETFIFGEDIVNEGFADILIESDDPQKSNKSDSVNNAKALFHACIEKTRNIKQDFSKIAAVLDQSTSITPGRPAFSNIQNEVNSMDKTQLKAEHPDVFQAIVKEAGDEREAAVKQTYLDQGEEKGQAAGILAERNRITAIDAIKSIPEDFKAKARSEDWSAEQTALEYLKLDAFDRKEITDDIEGNLKDAVASDAVDMPEDPKGKDEKIVNGKSSEEEMKAAFEKSEALKTEFGGDFERYKSYLKAESEGKVKIYQGGK